MPLSFNRAQYTAATGLLSGHNTLSRHLHIVGLKDSPLCRKCGAGEETSAHVLCECEALATLRYIYLGSLFLDPEDVRHLSLEVIWNFFKRAEFSWLRPSEGAQTACWRPTCIGTVRARPIFIHSFIHSFNTASCLKDLFTEEYAVYRSTHGRFCVSG
jgi:hypothetical protein